MQHFLESTYTVDITSLKTEVRIAVSHIGITDDKVKVKLSLCLTN
jgi:hypothetical protein